MRILTDNAGTKEAVAFAGLVAMTLIHSKNKSFLPVVGSVSVVAAVAMYALAIQNSEKPRDAFLTAAKISLFAATGTAVVFTGVAMISKMSPKNVLALSSVVSVGA